MTISGKGRVKLMARLPRGNRKVNRSSVLYVPDLFCNLLSVPQLTEKGVVFSFDKYGAIAKFQDFIDFIDLLLPRMEECMK